MIAQVYDWSGLYIGINAGGGSSCYSWAQGCIDATGGTVGGQIGYRWQTSHWVFGVEGQGNWADFSGSQSALNDKVVVGARMNSFGLITGQVGYAWDNMLLYVKGGAAVVNNRFDLRTGPGLNCCIANGTALSTGSETVWGGTVGAGLEIGIAPRWTLGIEYDHIFLPDRDVALNHSIPVNVAGTFPGGSYNAIVDFTASARASQGVNMGLARLNYKFGGPVVAKY